MISLVFGSHSFIKHRVMPFAFVHNLRNHCEILTPHLSRLHLPTHSAPITYGTAYAGLEVPAFSVLFAPLVQPNLSSFGDHEKRFVNRSYLDRRVA